jgi:hypothetical protein
MLSHDSVKGISVASGVSPLAILEGTPLGISNSSIFSCADEYGVPSGSQSVVPRKREDSLVLWNHGKKTSELCCDVCV